MICAYINGNIAYPVADSGVKIVLQNPFIKDGEEKTMEVVFPLSIPENKLAFGALNRLDTTFENDDFEDCSLLADNIEVVRGKGTITSITNEDVKIQILAGKSYLRYKASFDHIFIDQLDYGEVLEKHKLFATAKSIRDVSRLSVLTDLNNYGFIGQPGHYVFMPVHDESNDVWANAPGYIYNHDVHSDWYGGITTTIVQVAIQPNLMLVFKKVMQKLGYAIIRNDFDVSPWNKLYVASARVSLSMAKALPHWSCYKFLDEMRKLFNAVFLFDENKKTVSVVQFDTISGNDKVEIEPVEAFSTSYDEEGIEYLEASNLQYELSDCERTVDIISEEVRSMFEVREYESADEMRRAFFSMSVKDKMTSLFHCPAGWYYGVAEDYLEGTEVRYMMTQAGWFSPLIRKEGANYISLNIVPVAMKKSECRICRCVKREYSQPTYGSANWPNMVESFEGPIASVNCENQTEAEYLGTSAEKDVEYVTVQDILENGESGPEKESDNSTIEVFFVDGQKFKYRGELEFVERLAWGYDMPDPPSEIILPVPFTDNRQIGNLITPQVPAWSLSLNPTPGVTSIGLFHNQGLKIKRNVNGNNEICVKFVYHGKPDPSKIYQFCGKQFIASRIEMAANANGIDPLKTGYFYEIL